MPRHATAHGPLLERPTVRAAERPDALTPAGAWRLARSAILGGRRA